MLGYTLISRILFVLLVLLYWRPSPAYASLQPQLALYDIRQSKVLSLTKWREIDFGDRSSIAPGPQPARVYAIQAKLPIVGGSKPDHKDVHDYLLIPYCQNQSEKISSVGTDVCSLRRYKGYVLLRFRGGWEVVFSAFLWRDVTPNLNVMNALRSFQAAANDSSVTFPFHFDGSSYPGSSNDFIRRYEFAERCYDLTDECFQERYMTYTNSFKDFVWGQYTGRMLFYLGRKGAWNGAWTLRLESLMPFDSLTEVEAVIVLADEENSLSWSRWIVADPLGNIFFCFICLASAIGFILGVKELGIRLSHSIPVNEHRNTVLYDDGLEEVPCLFLHRVMLATQESLMKLLMLLRKLKDKCLYPFVLLTRRREGRAHLAVTVEAAADVTDESRGVEVREPYGTGDSEHHTQVNDDNSDEKEEDDEHLCRICRSAYPLEDLFAPCACDGSAKYVHRGCLEKWRTMTSNEEHRRICAECKTPYILVLERNTLSSNWFFRSPVCVPVFKVFIIRLSAMMLFVFKLWMGGYYLKLGMFIFSGLDEGVIWSAANVYHWVLGVYFITALGLNMVTLEYALVDYAEAWQQLLLLIASLWFLEIPLSYVGQIVLSWLLDRTLTLEVSYGVGIIVTIVLYVEAIPHLNDFLRSISTFREVVAPRREENNSAEHV